MDETLDVAFSNSLSPYWTVVALNQTRSIRISVYKKPIAGLIFLFFLNLLVWWPGKMTVDGINQYRMAVVGEYRDHHPFIMSFLWNFFIKILPGPGLMLVFHLSLFYMSLYYLLRCLSPRQAFWMLCLPFVPVIAGYAGVILKDVGMAYSFLLVASYLGFLVIHQKRLSLIEAGLLLCLVMYGSLVKFQGKYVAPIFLIWMALHVGKYHFNRLFLGGLVALSFSFYGLISGMITLAPSQKKDHAWQRTKLYDLSAISLSLKESVIPPALVSPNFSMEKLQQAFQPTAVDSLFEKGVLCYGQNVKERKELYHTWIHEVIKHPIFYLKHRLTTLGYILLCGMKMTSVQKFFHAHFPFPWAECGIGVSWIFLVMAVGHIVPVCLSVYCLRISWSCSSVACIPLFFFNIIGLSMVFIMLFSAMSACPRYTYVTACFAWCSLPFAYLCKKRS